MYQGTNPSALRSMRWLHRAMMELLEEEDYAQISVKSICVRAELSRQTFYQIFTGKEEILAYHFSLLFDEFIQSLPDKVPQTQVFFDRFFTFFYEQRHFIDILTRNHLTYLLEQKIEDHLQKIDLFRSTAQTAGHPDYMSAYLAGALTQMLLHWAENDYDLPAQTLSRFAWRASKGDFHPREIFSDLPVKACDTPYG